MLLDQVADVWRKLPSGPSGQYIDTLVYRRIWCTVEPISSLDAAIPFARQSTHSLWVPHWLVLHKEDQLRYGHRFGNVPADEALLQPWVYSVNGRVKYYPGVSQVLYYARELD